MPFQRLEPPMGLETNCPGFFTERLAGSPPARRIGFPGKQPKNGDALDVKGLVELPTIRQMVTRFGRWYQFIDRW